MGQDDIANRSDHLELFDPSDLSEPAQRWARRGLFFLVWSCPTPVAQAAFRDLAGLSPG